LIIDESDFEDGIRNRLGVRYRQTLNPIITGRTVILIRPLICSGWPSQRHNGSNYEDQ